MNLAHEKRSFVSNRVAKETVCRTRRQISFRTSLKYPQALLKCLRLNVLLISSGREIKHIPLRKTKPYKTSQPSVLIPSAISDFVQTFFFGGLFREFGWIVSQANNIKFRTIVRSSTDNVIASENVLSMIRRTFRAPTKSKIILKFILPPVRLAL